MKPKKCRSCKSVFTPRLPLQVACGPACAEAIAKQKRERKCIQDAREQRRSRREALEKVKTRQQWIAECQVVVNKVARLRDILAGYGCISCGSHPKQRYGGAIDAGHFRSVGSAKHLRFYLPNISAQCKKCNRDLGGAHSNYRLGLIERYGIEFVERIEAMQGDGKWSVEYLKRLKRIMSKKARRLERRIESRQ